MATEFCKRGCSIVIMNYEPLRSYMFMLMYQMKVSPEAHCLLDKFVIKIDSS